MTPQERQLVDDLFERLERLETAPRDAMAEQAIADGSARAPHAIYPLVQTVLIQDEALRRADARLRELTGEGPTPTGGGFLDSMREVLTGRGGASVPSVRPNGTSEPDPRWNRGGAFSPAAASSTGGSFLGTAAASAAGMIGGALLLNSISSMFGHHGSSAFAAAPASGSPWDNSASNSDLARDAGFDDVGKGAGGANAQAAGLLDNDDARDTSDFTDDVSSDVGGDFGGGDSG